MVVIWSKSSGKFFNKEKKEKEKKKLYKYKYMCIISIKKNWCKIHLKKSWKSKNEKSKNQTVIGS